MSPLSTSSPVSELVMWLTCQIYWSVKVIKCFRDILAMFLSMYTYENHLTGATKTLRVVQVELFASPDFNAMFRFHAIPGHWNTARKREGGRFGAEGGGETPCFWFFATKGTNWKETRQLTTECCFVLLSKQGRRTAGQPGKTCWTSFSFPPRRLPPPLPLPPQAGER